MRYLIRDLNLSSLFVFSFWEVRIIDKNQNAHFADGRLLINIKKNGNEKVPKMAKRLLISVDNDAHGPGTSFCHIYFFLFLKEALFFLIFCSHLFLFFTKILRGIFIELNTLQWFVKIRKMGILIFIKK